jgi:hypothetical protein
VSTPADPTTFPEAVEGSPTGHAPRTERQSIGYCPYCSEENLFPLEGGGWECRSCLRAFSVTFRGLVSPSRSREEKL